MCRDSAYFGLKVVSTWALGAKVYTIWAHGPLEIRDFGALDFKNSPTVRVRALKYGMAT